MNEDHAQIWVVDDDQDDQFLVEQAFNRISAKLAVRLIDDGDELLNSLQGASMLPQLVLLDINMNRMNGFETLQTLRSYSTYSDLPVVMLTTSIVAEDRKRALQLGASGFLIKPYRFEAMVTILRQLVTDWQLIS